MSFAPPQPPSSSLSQPLPSLPIPTSASAPSSSIHYPHIRSASSLVALLNSPPSHPDTHSYASLLKRCSGPTSLSNGRHIHAHILENGYEHVVFLGNSLIHMYAKCGSLEDASSMFDRMDEKNEFSWTILIAALVRHKKGKEALTLFQQLPSRGIEPDKVTCVTVLSVCANPELLKGGTCVHRYVVWKGIEHDVIVGNALVNMYGKAGRLEDALRLFYALHHLDVISWNVIIAAYVQHGKSGIAIMLFKEMQIRGGIPNSVTAVIIFSACASQGNLLQATEMHATFVNYGIELDGVMGNALISMYVRCGSIDEARDVFDKMSQRDVVTWNIMIGACGKQGQSDMSFFLYQQMISEGTLPDKVTYIAMSEACISKALIHEGRKVHSSLVENGWESDIVVQTALIHMYDKCEYVCDASHVFDRMVERDVVAWNAMIEACTGYDQCDQSLSLFQQMQSEGVKPDTYTYVSVLDACAKKEALSEGKKIHACLSCNGSTVNSVVETALLNMYGKCGDLKGACAVFKSMHKKDAIPWNALITAYAEHDHGRNALDLFEEMQKADIHPDEITFIVLLEACGNLIAVEEGQQMHCLVVESGYEIDSIVGTAIITMYGKCGCLEDAHIMFRKLPERCMVSWTTLITAHAKHGQVKNVLLLFDEMKRDGKVPTKATFMSVLTACSRAGLIDEGWSYFHSMSEDYGYEPMVDHYNCMIDLLGRGGHLKEAEDLISDMLVAPNATSWITLLSACHTYLDVERGENAAKRALELEPDNDAACVLLSNIYAASGRWDDLEMMRVKWKHDV